MMYSVRERVTQTLGTCTVLSSLAFTGYATTPEKPEPALKQNADLPPQTPPIQSKSITEAMLIQSRETCEKRIQDLDLPQLENIELKIKLLKENLTTYASQLGGIDIRISEEELAQIEKFILRTASSSKLYFTPPEYKVDSELFSKVLDVHVEFVRYIEKIKAKSTSDEQQLDIYEQRVLLQLFMRGFDPSYETPHTQSLALECYLPLLKEAPGTTIPLHLLVLQDRIMICPELTQSQILIEELMNSARRIYEDRELLIEHGPTISSLLRLMDVNEQSYFQTEVEKHLTDPESGLYHLQVLGPAYGASFARKHEPSKYGWRNVRSVLQSQKIITRTDRLKVVGKKTLDRFLLIDEPVSREELWIHSLIDFVESGYDDRGYFIDSTSEDTAVHKENREKRVQATAFALGFLAGYDSEMRSEVEKNKTRYNSHTLELLAEYDAVKNEVATKIRNNLYFMPLRSEERAAMLLQALWYESQKSEGLLEARQHETLRLGDIAPSFPGVVAAVKPGRYSLKVGEVVYLPPVRVKDPPAPYGALYFYTREHLTSHRHKKSWLMLKTPDEEIDALAREQADCANRKFLCDLLLEFLGEGRSIVSPLEYDRRLTPQHAQSESIKRLSQFKSYYYDQELRSELEECPAEEFISRVKSVREKYHLAFMEASNNVTRFLDSDTDSDPRPAE